jgi:hypothetical protein
MAAKPLIIIIIIMIIILTDPFNITVRQQEMREYSYISSGRIHATVRTTDQLR